MSSEKYDRVPVAVIAPIITEWVEKFAADHKGIKDANHEGHLSALAFRCGVSPRHLRRIQTNTVMGGNTRGGRNLWPVDYISFDCADKIVTHTLGPNAWHEDETLKPYYGPLVVTASELKQGFELPEGFDFDGLPTAQKAAWRRANAARQEEAA